MQLISASKFAKLESMEREDPDFTAKEKFNSKKEDTP